jgi:hypothetical protein
MSGMGRNCRVIGSQCVSTISCYASTTLNLHPACSIYRLSHRLYVLDLQQRPAQDHWRIHNWSGIVSWITAYENILQSSLECRSAERSQRRKSPSLHERRKRSVSVRTDEVMTRIRTTITTSTNFGTTTNASSQKSLTWARPLDGNGEIKRRWLIDFMWLWMFTYPSQGIVREDHEAREGHCCRAIGSLQKVVFRESPEGGSDWHHSDNTDREYLASISGRTVGVCLHSPEIPYFNCAPQLTQIFQTIFQSRRSSNALCVTDP